MCLEELARPTSHRDSNGFASSGVSEPELRDPGGINYSYTHSIVREHLGACNKKLVHDLCNLILPKKTKESDMRFVMWFWAGLVRSTESSLAWSDGFVR